MRRFIALAWLCLACGTETSGERVRVSWEMDQAQQEDRTDFATATGYQVHLDEARLALKAVYLYAPAAARLSAVAWFERSLERSLVSVAHAHGGVDVEKGRRVLAEWTKPMTVDVLSDSAVRLAETDAEGGEVDAVKLQLADAAVAHVRGHAERDGKRWYFEADVDPSDGVQRHIELLELGESLAEGSLVQLTVHPKTWLNLCEFDNLEEASGEDPSFTAVTKEDQVGRAIDIGVRSPNAFAVTIAAGDDHE